MMKAGIILGAGAAALAAVAACSSFDSADAPGGDGGLLPDGAPAPLTGVASADLQLAFDTPAMVMHGGQVHLPFTIVRGNQYRSTVVITAAGLPPTITSTSVSLQGIDSTGELVLTLSKDLPQGALAGVSIVADGQDGARPHASMPFAPFVRGTPGEIDTTFAKNGVLNVGDSSLGSEFAVDSSGKILVMNNSSLRRFDADGNAVESGFNVPFPTEKAALITLIGGSIYVARNDSGSDTSQWGGRITKISATGAIDTSFASGKGTTAATSYEQTGLAFDADGRFVSFYPNTDMGTFRNIVYAASGISTSSGNAFAHPQFVRAAVYLSDHSIVFAGNDYVGKLQADGATLDKSFGSNGFTLVAGTTLNDMILDSTNQLLVTGQQSSGPLYLTRFKLNGTQDGTFRSANGAYTARSETMTFVQLFTGDYTGSFVGRLTLDKNQDILQAGQTDDGGTIKCVIARYSKTGDIDQTFGNNGTAKLDPAGCYAHRIAVQPDGRILVGGPVVVRVWN